jgi:Glycosyltransferase sugar-binding region containing DXD motif
MVLTHGSLPKVLELLSHTVPHNFHSIIPQFQADWVRLVILQGLGGIWVDASFIMDKSVDLLVDTQIQEKTHGFMFYLDG